MGKRRWDSRKRKMRLKKPRRATLRTERTEVYRDPETKLLLQVGPDHGPPERRQHDGGIIIGQSVVGTAKAAWAVAPGALERLIHNGGLSVGLWGRKDHLDLLRRWLEAAELLRRISTIAGLQRKVTGRYELGVIGRGEMSEKAVAAHQKITELAERLGWGRLGLLLDLVLYEKLPFALERPRPSGLILNEENAIKASELSDIRNPSVAAAMEHAIAEHKRQLKARELVWEQACREVQDLLERLALAFGLRGPLLSG